ncbi:hypothetical protein PIB30_074491, partial [Stylosanthes scabra]|nr:hypothetical protein [Stylosanthes scabra]
ICWGNSGDKCRGPYVQNWLKPTNAMGEHHGTHALVQCRTPCMGDSTCNHKPPMSHPIPAALEHPCHAI